MGPIELFWGASLVGAGLMFSSGYLSGRSRRAPASESDGDESAALRERVETVERELAAARTATAAAERRAEQLRESAAKADERAQGLADAAAAAARRTAELERAAASKPRDNTVVATPLAVRTGDTVVAPMPSDPQPRITAMQTELAQMRERLAQTERALADERGTSIELREQLAGAQPADLREQLAALDARARAAEMRKAALEERLAALADLEAQLADARRDNGRLQDQLAARIPGSGPAPTAPPVRAATRPPPPPPSPAIDRGPDTVETVLTKHLTQLAAERASEATVLSDDHGLVLGGTGRELTQEHLAVLASLARTVVERAQEFIGMADVSVLELGDADGKGLRFRFFSFDDNLISLVCLGQHEMRTNAAEDRLISAFPRAVMGS